MSALATNGAALDVALNRLEAVKPYGRGYRARCPACGGRSHKLSITEADAGRILLHCFAGCAAASVVEAMGLTLADLFPERLAPQTSAEHREARRRLREASWGAALEVLAVESTIVLLAARRIALGNPLSREDHGRLMDGVRRVADAQAVFRTARDAWRPNAQ